MPSMNTPFFPLHFIKKLGCSLKISRCTRDIKLEWPMLTSTSPLLLFRPMVMRGFLIVNSKSLPSSRAIAIPTQSGLHDVLVGLVGADLRANKARAWLFVGCCIPDIAKCCTAKDGSSWAGKQHIPDFCLHPIASPTMHCTHHAACCPLGWYRYLIFSERSIELTISAVCSQSSNLFKPEACNVRQTCDVKKVL